ncbi:Hsp70 family protein [Dactylosporangium sp. NPDC051541]|uniref:Hsp70 family protein n=1 Tax=Dactylosporangium sp. NPDC051541 TaxID=3363977 RepID=UPI0037B4B42D
MTEPILVVDVGSWALSAAVVRPDRTDPVREPVSGATRWPAAAPERLGAALSAIAKEAGSVARLVLSAPVAARAAALEAAALAGFPDVELVPDAGAAVLDPQTLLEVPEGGFVLVCDLGQTWTATVAQVQHGRPVLLSQESSGSGRDLDVMLVADLRARLAQWVEPAFAAGGDVSLRANLHALDVVRRVKHRLADVMEAEEEVETGVPAYRLDRRHLDQLTEPGARWLVASARAVVARAGLGPSDVVAVLLVGGAARLPGIGPALHNGLGRPVTRPADPELAVLRGAAAWARARPTRAVPADPPAWRVEPLVWTVPGGRGQLVRWLVREGEAYGRDAPLAQVRTADDSVYDLSSGRSEGTLLEQRVAIGETIVSGAVAAHARLEPAGAERFQLAKRHHLRVAGDWLLTPDRRTLVECSGDGEYVKLRTIATGALVTELRPGRSAARQKRQAQVALGPGQQLALVTWDTDGHFAVWDVRSGRVTASFSDVHKPDAVLLNEAEWRLVATGEGAAHVGRYRRDVATVWDLATGARLDRIVGEDLPKRFTGYAETSRADAFAAEMRSPDGRLRAAAADGTLSVRDLETEAEVFRAELAPAHRVSTAFCHEGRHLLARGTDDEGTWVDVWEVLQPA